MTAAATGLATIGIAALPLERSAAVDTWHGAAAGVAYVTLAATPLLAGRSLRERGHRRLAALSGLVGVVTATSLALSLTGLPTGLFQRIGLTTGDLWIMVSADRDHRASSGPGLEQATGVIANAAMSVYFIANSTIDDQALLDEYVQAPAPRWVWSSSSCSRSTSRPSTSRARRRGIAP